MVRSLGAEPCFGKHGYDSRTESNFDQDCAHSSGPMARLAKMFKCRIAELQVSFQQRLTIQRPQGPIAAFRRSRGYTRQTTRYKISSSVDT